MNAGCGIAVTSLTGAVTMAAGAFVVECVARCVDDAGSLAGRDVRPSSITDIWSASA
jgi:hypothetical protein